MSLIEYYKTVIESLGMEVSDDGFVKIKVSEDNTVMQRAGGLPIVLPTDDHIGSLRSIDDNGKPVVSKVLFNPLNENVIKGDSIFYL